MKISNQMELPGILSNLDKKNYVKPVFHYINTNRHVKTFWRQFRQSENYFLIIAPCFCRKSFGHKIKRMSVWLVGSESLWYKNSESFLTVSFEGSSQNLWIFMTRHRDTLCVIWPHFFCGFEVHLFNCIFSIFNTLDRAKGRRITYLFVHLQWVTCTCSWVWF